MNTKSGSMCQAPCYMIGSHYLTNPHDNGKVLTWFVFPLTNEQNNALERLGNLQKYTVWKEEK